MRARHRTAYPLAGGAGERCLAAKRVRRSHVASFHRKPMRRGRTLSGPRRYFWYAARKGRAFFGFWRVNHLSLRALSVLASAARSNRTQNEIVRDVVLGRLLRCCSQGQMILIISN